MLLARAHLQRSFSVVGESGRMLKRIARFVVFGGQVDIYDDEE